MHRATGSPTQTMTRGQVGEVTILQKVQKFRGFSPLQFLDTKKNREINGFIGLYIFIPTFLYKINAFIIISN